MNEKMSALIKDEEFVKKLMECEEPEAAQALFAQNGVELSLEEIKTIGKGIDMALSDSEELDEDALDAVAGGVSLGDVVDGIVSAVKTVVKNWRSIKNWFRRW